MPYPGETLVIKMWESLVDKGIGGLLRPRQIRKEGSAAVDVRVEEKLRLAQAEQHAQAILRGEATLEGNTVVMLPSRSSIEVLPPSNPTITSDTSITEKIISASTADAIRKEVNIAKAILEAEAELENDSSLPPEQPINDDWLYRWRDYASEVSSEELQSMWGKVLAGETKAPGSFSLRTMDFLRNVSQKEAQDIAKLAPYVIGNMIYRDQKHFDQVGLPFGLFISMQELGILSGVEALGIRQNFNSSYLGKYVRTFVAKSRILIIEHDDAAKTASIPIFLITPKGEEILRLCKDSSIDELYLRKLGTHLIRDGFKVILATVTSVENGTVTFNNQENLELSTV